MPIISTRKTPATIVTPATAAPDPTDIIQISAPQYSGVAVDQRWTPKSNLLTHVEGSSWIVDYYSQVLGKDSPLSGQQISLSSPYQSYKKIVGLEIKVTSALSTSQDDESKEMSVNGSAVVYHSVVPNDGDMFVADIGEGKKGLFRITSSTKKSIFRVACYEIGYSLDTDQEAKRNDLESKVVESLYFNKDYLNLGRDPLILASDHQARLELKKTYEVMIYQYFKKFMSNEYKTLVLPAQKGRSVYDHFLVKFLLDTIDNWDCHEARFVRALVVDDDHAMQSNSFWTALQHREAAYLETSFTRTALVSTRTFTANPRLNGIRFTGIDQVVYPTDAVVTVNGELVSTDKPLSTQSVFPSPTAQGQLNAMVRAINLQTLGGEWGEVFPVTQDSCYVLSEAFYSRASGQSYLESLVWRYLDGESLQAQVLLDVSKAVHGWGILEQFYYTPILMLFIKSLIMEGR